MKTDTWADRERIRSRLWQIQETVRERMPHLDAASLKVIDGFIAEAIEPLEAIDLPLTGEAEDAKTAELRKAINLLETLRRARRTGFVDGSVLTPLISRNARLVERLARQLSRLSTPKGKKP